jgi:hypothetical protein
LYGSGLNRALLFRRWRVYHGVWGSGLFQSIYEIGPGRVSTMPLMPEWYLALGGLVGLSLLGLLWWPLLFAAPLALGAASLLFLQSSLNARDSSFVDEPLSAWGRLKRYAGTTLMYLMQPLARLRGRLSHGLTPWRRRTKPHFAFPRPRHHVIWSEDWQALTQRLQSLEMSLRAQGAVVHRGGEYDVWDLEIRGGLFGTVRARATIEEHGGGKQLVRLRSWPRYAPSQYALTVLFTALAVFAAIGHAWIVTAILALAAAGLALSGFADCAAATASYLYALRQDRLGAGVLIAGSDAAHAGEAMVRPAQPQVSGVEQQRPEAP